MPLMGSLTEAEILSFALILIRITAFLFSWPIFGGNSTPLPVKILMSVVISMCLYPVITLQGVSARDIEIYLPWLALREVCIGLMLGFISRLFFFAVSVGGQIISVSMGLSAAQLFNPALQGSGSAVEQVKVVVASILFLAMNGHHLLLAGLIESFNLVPISVQGISFASMGSVAALGQEVLMVGVKIAAPVMIAILLTNVAMGVVGRAVPQFNVLINSLPVTIGIGFMVMLLTVPLFHAEAQEILRLSAEHLFSFMRTL